MKKFISSALALTLIASVLAGCSSNTASTSDPGRLIQREREP